MDGVAWITQPNLQYKGGRGESQVASSAIVTITPFALSLGSRWMTNDLGFRVTTRRKRRIVRRKRTSPFGYAKKMEVWEERRKNTHRTWKTAEGA